MMSKYFIYTLTVLLFLLLVPAKASDFVQLEQEMTNASGSKKANLLLLLADRYLPEMSDLAENYARRALRTGDSLRDDYLRACSYYVMGKSAMYSDSSARASEYLLKAQSIFRESDKREHLFRTDIMLGIFYSDKELKKAVEILQKVSLGAASENMPLTAAKAHAALGDVYMGSNNFVKALEEFQKGLAAKFRNNDSLRAELSLKAASAAFNKALNTENIESVPDRYDISIKKQLNVKKGVGFHSGESDTSAKREVIRYSIDLSLVLQYLNQALKYAQRASDNISLYKIYRQFYEVYFYKGDYEQALKYFTMYDNQRQKNENLRKERLLNTLRVQYEVFRQQQSIELLEKDNEIKKLENISQKRELENKTLQRNILLIIALAALVALVAGLIMYRMKRKSALLLENKNKELSETYAKVSKSEEKLSELNALKDKIFKIISNDLQRSMNSFMSVSMFLPRQLETMTAEEMDATFNDMDSAVAKLNSLLENLKIWSQSQTGNISNEPEKLNFLDIAEHVYYHLKKSISDKNIDFRINVENNLFVYADLNLTIHIMHNLVSNAVKFTGQGGRVEIRAEFMGKNLLVDVIDDGIGISKKQQEKIFEIQQRDDDTTALDESSGSGIGLILCKEFTNMIGGSITVSSEPGNGSVFSFTIPKADK